MEPSSKTTGNSIIDESGKCVAKEDSMRLTLPSFLLKFFVCEDEDLELE
jgi:hypothetical protein